MQRSSAFWQNLIQTHICYTQGTPTYGLFLCTEGELTEGVNSLATPSGVILNNSPSSSPPDSGIPGDSHQLEIRV